MVSPSADNANAYPVAFVPASKSVDDVDTVPCVQVINSTFTVDAPDLSWLLAMLRPIPTIAVTVLHETRRNDAGQPIPQLHVHGSKHAVLYRVTT